MKCSNPIKCDGEMKPLKGWPKYTECEKCGYRIDTPSAPVSKKSKAAPVIEETILPTEDKENN